MACAKNCSYLITANSRNKAICFFFSFGPQATSCAVDIQDRHLDNRRNPGLMHHWLPVSIISGDLTDLEWDYCPSYLVTWLIWNGITVYHIWSGMTVHHIWWPDWSGMGLLSIISGDLTDLEWDYCPSYLVTWLIWNGITVYHIWSGMTVHHIWWPDWSGMGLLSIISGVGLLCIISGTGLLSIISGLGLLCIISGTGLLSIISGLGLLCIISGTGLLSIISGLGLLCIISGTGLLSIISGVGWQRWQKPSLTMATWIQKLDPFTDTFFT